MIGLKTRLKLNISFMVQPLTFLVFNQTCLSMESSGSQNDAQNLILNLKCGTLGINGSRNFDVETYMYMTILFSLQLLFSCKKAVEGRTVEMVAVIKLKKHKF